MTLTPAIGEALYVGLVTDTGRFMYENTGPRAHEMAAALLDGGVDGHGIYRRLYEGMPQGKLELLARGLTHVERYDGGLLTVTHLTLEDYRATGADESYSEGVVDHLRSVEGTAVAALDPRPADGGDPAAQGLPARHRRPRRRVADRPLAGRRRPSPRRRLLDRPGLPGAGRGPAHRARPAALSGVADGVVLFDKPAGITSHDVVAQVRRRPRPRREGGPRGDARSVRDRAAAGARRPRDARAAVPDGAAQALRDGRAARLDLDDRRPGGRAGAGADAARAARAPDRRAAPAPARLQRREDRRRARLREGAPRRGGRDRRARGDRHPLRAALARGRPRGAGDRVLLGDLRALARRRPRRRLLPRAAPDRDRPVRRRRRRRGADRAALGRARLPARGAPRGRRRPQGRPRRGRERRRGGLRTADRRGRPDRDRRAPRGRTS